MAPTHIEEFEIPWTDTVRPEDETDMFPYVKQTRKTEVLSKGWQKNERSRPLPCEIIYDQNIELRHSDGTKIYIDVLRPTGPEKVPALLAVSPYGKNGAGFDIYGNIPFRLGIPESKLSALEKFESVDPAEWTSRGYAVINVDIRGSWESEGNLYIEGSQPGVDVAEICEQVAAMEWCNGNIGMQGNSWLATTQWTTAAQAPPSLKAIAPFEGFTDKYRDVVCRGGISSANFVNFIYNRTIRGRQKREDIVEAAKQWPLINAYWEDKDINVSKVKISMYVVASYASPIHAFSCIKAWKEAASEKKWLRIHPTFEWYDLYDEWTSNELQRFFDRYLKGINNDWETTERVRVSILTFNDRFGPKPIVNHVFPDYPPPATDHRAFYLHASALSTTKAEKHSTVSYQSDDVRAKPSEFLYTFDKSTTLVGYSKALLWVSCSDMNDMDIYLSIRKVSKSGKVLEHLNIPWEAVPDGVNNQDDVPNTNLLKFGGCTGVLRLSHRYQDPKLSTPWTPRHPHKWEDKVEPGKIVSVEIGFWPIGIHFDKGESLMLRAQGFLDQAREFPDHMDPKPQNLNRGRHIIHVGREYDSCLFLPVVRLD